MRHMANDTTRREGIRERFLADHREIEALLEKVLATCEDGDREDVAAVWTEFDARLLAHMDAEERYLVPLLKQQNPQAARAILEEHKHFRARLTELCTEVDLHTIRLREARSFIGELRAHSAHEDKTLYSLADQALQPPAREPLFTALLSRTKHTARAPARGTA
jgi:hemerythrin-like domain-containing protein